MSKYIAFEIKNLEDVKVAGTIGQSDSEYSISYLSGSSIRGAYIANYINLKGVRNINTGEHKGKLLQGGIKFYNAYPMVEDKRSLPIPKCIYADKDVLKSYNGRNPFKVINHFTKKDLQEDYDRVRLSEFCYLNIEDKIINPVHVEKVSSIHIKKGKENNEIFRYEAIKSGQKFMTFIKCEDCLVDECKQILEKCTFYIGGSKGSGYGKCNIENIKVCEENPELSYFKEGLDEELNEYFEDIEECEDERYMYIYLTSDMIYRDEYGVYKTYIDDECLKQNLGLLEVNFEESFVDTTVISGFNNKWNCHMPHIVGIRAGSILKYKYKGDLDADKVEKFIDRGIGERRSEGYGKLLVLKELQFDEFKPYKITKEESVKPPIELSKEDRKQLSIILNRIYKSKLETKICENVLELDKMLFSDKEFKNNNILSKNQWGNLYEIMFIIENGERQEGKDKLKKFLEHIKEKKTNRQLFHSLKGVKFKISNQQIDLYEYLVKFCKTVDDIYEFEKKNYLGFN